MDGGMIERTGGGVPSNFLGGDATDIVFWVGWHGKGKVEWEKGERAFTEDLKMHIKPWIMYLEQCAPELEPLVVKQALGSE